MTSQTTPNSSDVEFVSVDWGTSVFRLWGIDGNGQVLVKANGPFGMSKLQTHEFASVLENELRKLSINHSVPVIICGMAGAAQGWHEAPYLESPTELANLSAAAVRVPDFAYDVRILPGVMQSDPGNVMRGEETQILGLLLDYPEFEGVVCLPGTHSKWVQISNGCIHRFTTCITGELFALLGERSVLKHAMVDGGWDNDAYLHAVNATVNTPAIFANSLFSLRADMLLANQPSAIACAKLSGMLVGLEMAANRSYWQDKDVTLIGDASLCKKYSQALRQLSASVHILDGEAMTLNGLIAAYRQR